MEATEIPKKSNDICIVLSMVFLWPCLIPTTYYPSITASSISENLIGYPFYLVYPSLLLASIVIAFTAHKAMPHLNLIRKKSIITCGMVGSIGHALIVAPLIWSTIPAWLFTFGLILAATYVTTCIIIVGSMLSNGTVRTVAMRAVLSFAIWEIVSLACEIVQIDTGMILFVSPLLTAGFMLFAGELGNIKSTGRIPSSNVPWYMIICSIAFVFFDVVYVKILFAQDPGASDSLHIFTSLVALLVSVALVALIQTRPFSDNFFVTAFATLVILYIASLVIVLLIPDVTNIIVKRLWAASGRCFKMFVFLVLCCLVNKRHLQATTAFCLFLCSLVALPNYISFDLSYQSPILDLIVHTDMVGPLAIVATFVTAALSIVLLLRETRKLAQTAQRQNDKTASPCKDALRNHDLSEREMQVAEYVYRGYSAKRTAEALFLSESTINSYTRTLYRKLDIHSKQDLIQLVDSYFRSPDIV